MAEMLTGLCVPRLSAALMRQADWRVTESSLCGQMTADMAERLTKTADAWLLPIRGVKGFESAQVASGGAAVADFDPATLQNRRLPGLYAAGEVLDVDGDCGGFNLMFAFGSGILAGLDGRNARGYMKMRRKADFSRKKVISPLDKSLNRAIILSADANAAHKADGCFADVHH